MSTISTAGWLAGWLARSLGALAAAALCASCATFRASGDSEALLTIEALAAGDRSRLLQRSPGPLREELRFSRDRVDYEATLYTPPGPVQAGLVLVPGLHRLGRHIDKLVDVGHALAHLGFLVLIPDLPGMRRLVVYESNVDDVENALAYLRSRPALPDSARLGVAGMSYSAGPVLLAAARAPVDFVATVGGYHDLDNVVRYITTRTIVDPDSARSEPAPIAPAATSRWYFALSNIELIEDPADRAKLRRLVVKKVMRQPRNLKARLDVGPQARSLLDLVTNTDLERVGPLLRALPRPIRDRMRVLSPSTRDLACVQVPVFLIHGRHDDAIPPSESRDLAQRLPPGRARLFLLDSLTHVEFTADTFDPQELVPLVDAILAQRAPRAGPRRRGGCDP